MTTGKNETNKTKDTLDNSATTAPEPPVPVTAPSSAESNKDKDKANTEEHAVAPRPKKGASKKDDEEKKNKGGSLSIIDVLHKASAEASDELFNKPIPFSKAFNEQEKANAIKRMEMMSKGKDTIGDLGKEAVSKFKTAYEDMKKSSSNKVVPDGMGPKGASNTVAPAPEGNADVTSSSSPRPGGTGTG